MTGQSIEFLADVRAQAQLADRLGMHSFWVGESHLNNGNCIAKPELLLAAIAAQTTRIRIGPAVTILPLHHPLHTAETWATLDALSNGRVDFVAGRGYDRDDYDRFGVDFYASSEIFDEQVEIIRSAWSRDSIGSHAGRYFDIPQIPVTILPVQAEIPFYVAVSSYRSLDSAAAKGLNLVFAPFAPALFLDGISAAVNRFDSLCVDAGRPRGKVALASLIHVAETKEEVSAGLNSARSYVESLLKSSARNDSMLDHFRKIIEAINRADFAELAAMSIFIGSATDIAGAMKNLDDIGVDELLLYFGAGHKSHNTVETQISRFMSDVAPHVESAFSESE